MKPLKLANVKPFILYIIILLGIHSHDLFQHGREITHTLLTSITHSVPSFVILVRFYLNVKKILSMQCIMHLTFIYLFSMTIQNRKQLWKQIKDRICQSSNNQVAPEAPLPVIQEENIVAVGTAEILNIVTISVYIINVACLSQRAPMKALWSSETYWHYSPWHSLTSSGLSSVRR